MGEGRALKKSGRNEEVWEGRALGSLFFLIVFLETWYPAQGPTKPLLIWGNSNCTGG